MIIDWLTVNIRSVFGADNRGSTFVSLVPSQTFQHFMKYRQQKIEEEGGMETEIAKRVGAGWMNWKKCSGVLCDKKMPVKLKGKVYRTVVRPAMLYGAETWATTKRQESRIEVNEMRMLRWMCGVTRKDKIRNEHIRGTTKVAQASRKIMERRLKWYGHVMRMEEDHVVKRVMTKAIPGKRKRGRPKTRWKDVCKRDMQTVGLREGDARDRAYWKEMINNHSGDPRWREKPEEKKKKRQQKILLLWQKIYGRLLCLENIAILYLPVTHNEPIFAVSISPNSTEITKLVLNNNTSNVCISFAMTSKMRKSGRISKQIEMAEAFF